PSPYVGEIAEIAAIAGRPGVWFVNASYEWGCTTRIDVEPAPILRRTLDWPFPGLGRHVEVALQDGGAGPYASLTWPGASHPIVRCSDQVARMAACSRHMEPEAKTLMKD
ncbi:MAG: hypothetical protein ACJ8DE_16585, partial [Microvirga sp.]